MWGGMRVRDACNDVAYSGAETVAAALQDVNCKLHALYLRVNRIGAAGPVTVAAALQNANCKLHTLDLSSGRSGCDWRQTNADGSALDVAETESCGVGCERAADGGRWYM
ncbi:hypothetical protein CYMTET_56477 [Cymbomonas tetramitiformis]|uniref:Uncharacterized protein n=1 Tax=Cymbomonas tetramitiformis TaxID=36881 RepID=A0AAE0BCK8_9CHLO|nr:hypothetical protein CYMTET_56477 [Cymbomonas tetramitiformis]